MKVELECVEGFVKKEIPPKGETIDDDMDVKLLAPLIREFMVYYRPSEKCPKGRGNWVLDIKLANKELYCLKLPKEMTEEHVKEWIKPLTDRLEAIKKSKLN